MIITSYLPWKAEMTGGVVANGNGGRMKGRNYATPRMNPTLGNYLLDTGHIYAVIGGTHLGPVSDEQKEKNIDALKAFDIEGI